MKHTYTQMVDRLNERGIAHRTITLEDGSLLLVSSYGGRVYGPFEDPQAECPMWVPDAFSNPQSFADLIDSGAWNMGGERMWIGPEVTYIIEDRDDYWGTFVVPPCIDPAPHTFRDIGHDDRGDVLRDGPADQIASRHGSSMTRNGSLVARHTGTGTVEFAAVVNVVPAPSPFRYMSGGSDSLRQLKCAGYTVEIDIKRSQGEGAPLETWDIVQVPNGGTVVIPSVGLAEVTDYYEPAGDMLAVQKGATFVKIGGEDKFKIGFKAPTVPGRAGYLLAKPDGSYGLLVRNIAVDPAAPYGEEPDFAPGVMGDALHVYSDDGPLGGFGEVEARGLPTGTDTGRLQSKDRFTSWWMNGSKDEIAAACLALLGVSMEEVLS